MTKERHETIKKGEMVILNDLVNKGYGLIISYNKKNKLQVMNFKLTNIKRSSKNKK